MVIDWRAPVSRPFYRASQADPMGLYMRRRFGFAGGELTAYEDEDFTASAAASAPAAARDCRRAGGQPHPAGGDRAAQVGPDA